MNSRREHRIKVYNTQYKKYLCLMKKTGAQRTRNRLLQSTNSELSKEIAKLKEEIRKSLLINSNTKTEIYDLSVDKDHLMEENKGLYNTLTTLHNDAVAFEKRISHVLNSVDPEIKSFDAQKVNGKKNPKDLRQLPETNYQKYNFKDFIYIQDLSPIMEENAEVKKLIKPSDITRRLGHRAKVLHPDKCSENVEVNGEVLDEDDETNLVNCSPSSAGNFYKDIKNAAKQSPIVEEAPTQNVNAEEVLSISSDESNNVTADESIISCTLPNHSESLHTTTLKSENDGASPLPIDDVVPPSDSENTLNEKNFHSSLFANVFPRRKVINNMSSFSLGSVEEENNDEPNSTNIEKENPSPRVSSNSLKKDLDQSRVSVKSDSFLQCNSIISHENNSGLASEMSHQEESIIENTCSDIRHFTEIITKDIKCGIKAEATTLDSSCGKLENSLKLAEDKNEEREISASFLKKPSGDSSVICSPMKNSSQFVSQGSNSEGRASLHRHCSKKSSLDATHKIVLEKKNEVKKLSRSADRTSVNSSKNVTLERKSPEDSKKSLRPKKPINFAESPVVKTNPKRKRKLEKAGK